MDGEMERAICGNEKGNLETINLWDFFNDMHGLITLVGYFDFGEDVDEKMG